MVDPFTIIGTTAAVLDLVHFAGKVINTAYSLYDSTSSSMAENAELNDVTVKMNQLLDGLQAQTHSAPQPDLDESMTPLVTLCHRIGERIIFLLEKSKMKKPHSLRECIRAAMATVWTKGVVNDLRIELAYCLNLLNVHMTSIMKSETGEKLKAILAANESIAKELSPLRECLEKFTKLGESLGQICDILSPSEASLRDMKQKHFLESLKFQDMESRFEQIPKAAIDTFQWCLQDVEVPKSHPDLKISLREWLVKGQGIFHISGNPGSGKSTLLKFIASHGKTECYLKEWAGTRTLVVANFFIWKPGKRLQKNLEGLLRSLVYRILSNLPNLISTVFPRLWDRTVVFPRQPQRDLEIPYEDIFSAFQNLVKSSDAMKDFCFCFFIDALDEFDDPEQMHTMLAQQLKAWTDRNPENFKICVSSREDNPFMDNFSLNQRLRLHLLTENDIRTMIVNHLDGHPRFREEASEGREKLVRELVSRAEGIFLWVRLVLNELWKGLDDKQTLAELHDTLNTIPDDLMEFYKRILRLIPRNNRREAWTIFKIFVTTNASGYLSLFHYSFVKEFLKNQHFAIKQDLSDTTVLEITRRADSFRSKLHRLCGGLMEVREVGKRDGIYTDDDRCHLAFKDSIKFIHRSVYDFLNEELPEDIRGFFESIDVKAIIMNCLIAQLKLIPWDGYVRNEISDILSACFDFLRESSIEDKHLELMGSLDDALLQRQHGSSTAIRIDWSSFDHFKKPRTWGLGSRGFTSLLAYSCFAGFQEYVIWSLENRASLSLDERTRVELLVVASPRYDSFPDVQATVKLLRYLIKRCNPNSHQGPPWRDGLSASQSYVMNLFIFGPSDAFWEVIQVYLEHGLDPCFIFTLREKKSEEIEGFIDKSIDATIRMGPNFKEVTENSISSETMISFLEAAGPNKSLRDIVEFLQPHNMTEILKLIDRNLALHEQHPPMESVDTISFGLDEKPNSTQDSYIKRPWLQVDTIWGTLRTWKTPLSSFVIGMLSDATPRVVKT